MKSATPHWGSILLTAGIATATLTAVTAYLGKKETGSSAAPLNATSHILLGDEAAERDEMDVKHTATGALLNAGAMGGWALVQDLLFGRWVRRGSRGRALVSGALTSALAYVTDYYIVPKRLTPGFEKRLSGQALGIIYATLAISLAAGLAIHEPRKE